MTDYKELSNGELADLLKASDHNAFSELLNRYSALLINFTYRRVGDLQLTEDLVSDVWTDLWEKRLDLTIYKGFEPFIFTAVRNRILDYFRRQKISQKYIDSFQDFVSKEYNKTDYLVRHNDLQTLIEREIAALPENMRKVFELNRKTEMTRKEIAGCLNMPENSVKSNMQRALRILKSRLGDFLIFFYLVFEILPIFFIPPAY